MLGVDLDDFALLVFLQDDELGILDYLVRALPLESLQHRTPLGHVGCVLIELGAGARELCVHPLLAGVALDPGHDFLLLLQVQAHVVVGFGLLVDGLALVHLLGGVLDLQLGVRGSHVAIAVHQIDLLVVAVEELALLLGGELVAFALGVLAGVLILFWVHFD